MSIEFLFIVLTISLLFNVWTLSGWLERQYISAKHIWDMWRWSRNV